MSQSLPNRLADVPLKPAKAGLVNPDRSLNRLKDAGALIQLALRKAGIQDKVAASVMGISGPQFSAQIAGREHLSWQRLCELPDSFFVELLILLAEKRGIARVRMQLELERKAVNE